MTGAELRTAEQIRVVLQPKPSYPLKSSVSEHPRFFITKAVMWRRNLSGNYNRQYFQRSCLDIAFYANGKTLNKYFSDSVAYRSGSCLLMLKKKKGLNISNLIKLCWSVLVSSVFDFGVPCEWDTGGWCQCSGGFGEQGTVWSLGGTDWLQRRAGGGAALLSGQQDAADTQTVSSSC